MSATWFLLQIDRSKPFDPVAFFFGDGSMIVEQDERALTLTEVNLFEVWFDTMFRDRTLSYREERLKRLITPGKIRLDAKVLQTLWENKTLIPEGWKSHGAIFFEGTIIRSLSDDGLFILSLTWRYDMWHVGAAWWGINFKCGNHSACLIV